MKKGEILIFIFFIVSCAFVYIAKEYFDHEEKAAHYMSENEFLKENCFCNQWGLQSPPECLMYNCPPFKEGKK